MTFAPNGEDYNNLLVEHWSLCDCRGMTNARFFVKLVVKRIDSRSLLSQIYYTVPRRGSQSMSTFFVPRERTVLARAPITHIPMNANSLCADPFGVFLQT